MADLFMGVASLAWALAGLTVAIVPALVPVWARRILLDPLAALLVRADHPADRAVVDDRHHGSHGILGLGGVRARWPRSRPVLLLWGAGVVAGAGAAMARHVAAVAVPGRRHVRSGPRGGLGRGPHTPWLTRAP